MAQAIGVVSQTEGTVTALSDDGNERTLNVGDQVFEGEVLSTEGQGSGINVTFNNGCKMSLGEGETALIDETVYKLEFFDNAEVAVDLESAEGISKEIAELEEAEIDEVYLAETDDEIKDIDLDEMEETAAGGGTTESSQVDEAVIDERIEFEEPGNNPQGQGKGNTAAGFTPPGLTVDDVERGGEYVTPEAPTITIVNINGIGFVNDTPILSGSAPEGSDINIYDFEEDIGTITVDSSGTFTYEPTGLEDGEHSLTATVTTPDGVTGDMSDPVVFTLDTVAPLEATIESSDVTNIAAPTITGTAESLSRVEVTIDGETYTTFSDDHGIWSVSLNDTADGSYSVNVTVTDQAGNVSQSTTTELTIDQTLPDAPVIEALGVLSDTTPTINGTAEAGSTVAVFDGDTELGSVSVNADGSWSLTTEALAEGSHTITAVSTDTAGNVSGTSLTQALIVDTTAPELPVVEMPDITNSSNPTFGGTVGAGDTVSVTVGDTTLTTVADSEGSWEISLDTLADGTYDVSVVVTDTAGNDSPAVTGSITIDQTAPDTPTIEALGALSDTTPTINGTAEAGSTVAVFDGDTELGSVSVNADGSWSLTTEALAEGSHTITAVSTDTAGNVSGTSLTQALIVDTTAPDAPTIDPIDMSNVSTPTITGTAESNNSVAVTVGNENYTTTADADGNWSVTTTTLSDGSYTITAAVTDSAGNVSSSALSQSFVVDTTAPEDLSISGITIVDMSTAVISGTSEVESQVTVTVANQDYTATTDANGNWTLTTSDLDSGNYTITATATDSAGNTSKAVTGSILLDTTSITYDIDYDASGSEGTAHSIEDTTLYGIKTDGNFDPDATTLDLSSAQTDNVTTHNKGYGVEDGGKGEDRAIGANEAFVIELDAPVESMDVSINKLSFFEGGRWIAYDENMEQVGESSFGFIDSLFGSDESYDTGLFQNGGTVTINADAIEGEFQYVVFTTNDGIQGKISSYFVEELSYDTADAYIYDLTIENVPMDDAITTLHINGLDESLSIEDSEGNSIGAYENGTWTLEEDEINEIGTINGELNLQIISDTALESDSLNPTFTLSDISLDTVESDMSDALSPLSTTTGIFDFENLEDVQRIDLSEDEINMNSLNLKDVMKLSDGDNRLEIISGEHDEHVLTLNADDWTVKTDLDGNEVSFESDGNAYTVYTSTDADNEYDLIIDEMVSVVLGS